MKFKRLLSFAAACAMAVTSLIGTMSITASAEEGDVLQDEYWAYWDEGDHYRLSTYVGAASTGSDVVIPGYYNEKPVSAELTLSRDKVSVTYPDVPEVEPYTITPTYSSNALTKNKTLTTVTVNHTGTVNMTMRYASVLENVYLYCSELILNSDFNNNNNDVAIYHVTNESVKNTLVAAGISEANVLIDLQTSNETVYNIGLNNEKDVTAAFDSETGTLTISGTGETKGYSNAAATTPPWVQDGTVDSIKQIIVEDGVIPGNYLFEMLTVTEYISLPETLTDFTPSMFLFDGSTSDKLVIDVKGAVTNVGLFVFSFLAPCGTIQVYDQNSYDLISEAATAATVVLMSNGHDHGAVVATYEVGSSTASDVTATLYEDGCFIVSGTGAMKNYTTITLPWGTGSSGDSNINSIKNVVVEEGVTSVGNYAFRYAAALETVELAESVTTIGNYAFASCGTESTTYDFKGKISSVSASAFNTSTYGTVYVYDIDSYNTVSARAKSSMTVEFKGEIPTSGEAGETATYTYDPDTSTLTISGTGTVDKKLSLYKNVKNIVIEDGITGIAASEFLGFTAEKIEIKGTISTVGSNAFSNVTAEINTYVPSTYKIIKELATEASSVNYLGTEPIPDPVVKVITDFTGDTTFIPGDGTIIGKNVPYLVVNYPSKDICLLSQEDKDKITSMASTLRKVRFTVEVTGEVSSEFTLMASMNGGNWNVVRGSNRGGTYISPTNATQTGVKVTEPGTYTFDTIINIGYTSEKLLDHNIVLSSVENSAGTNNPNVSLKLSKITLYDTTEDVAEPLDYTALDAAIAEGEAVDTTKYTEATVKILTDAIAAAKAVKENANATQTDVDNAVKAITDAISALEAASVYPITYDVSASSDGSVILTLNEDGSVVVSGSGAMKNYSNTNSPWYKDGNYLLFKSVEIADGVTGVGNYAFWHCSNLTTLTIADSVTSIGDQAFRYCGLTGDVYVPEGVTTLAACVFGNNTSADLNVYVKGKITSTGNNPFLLCAGKIYVYDSNTYNLVTGTSYGTAEVIYAGTVVIDTTDLEAAIAQVEALNESDYTADTWAAVASALEAAKAELANEDKTSTSVMAATTALTNAIDGLIKEGKYMSYIYKNGAQANIVSCKVTDAMAGATKIKVNFDCASDVSYNPYAAIDFLINNDWDNNYEFKGTDGSYKTGTTDWSETLELSSALVKGNSFTLTGYTYSWGDASDYVYAVTSVEFIDADGNVLYTVTSDTVMLDTTELESAIAKGEAVDADKYTAESYAVLTSVISTAKAVLENAEATQEDIDAAAKAITDAINALELKVITGTVTGTIKVSDEDDSTEMTVTAIAADGTETSVIATSMGTYVLKDLALGDYTLTISGGKYAPRSYEITVETGEIAQDVELNPYGDINGDGLVTTADVGMANSHAKGVSILEGYKFVCADVKIDGSITTADVGMINSHAKGVKTLW